MMLLCFQVVNRSNWPFTIKSTELCPMLKLVVFGGPNLGIACRPEDMAGTKFEAWL